MVDATHSFLVGWLRSSPAWRRGLIWVWPWQGQLYSAKVCYPQPLLTYSLCLLTLTKIWCSLEYTAAPCRHPGMWISNPKCLGVERLKWDFSVSSYELNCAPTPFPIYYSTANNVSLSICLFLLAAWQNSNLDQLNYLFFLCLHLGSSVTPHMIRV